MLRKVVVVGDPPSSGGAVLPNNCRSSINDVAKAWIGGKVWCEACKSEGLIAKAGGPYRPMAYGGEEVLEGDLVLCQCPVAPKLIAKAVSSGPPMVTVDDRIESLGALPPPFRQFCNFSGVRCSPHDLPHTIQFQVIDEESGKPVPHTRYLLVLSNNTEVIGITDAKGFTDPVGNDTPFTADIKVPYYGGRKGKETPPINSDDLSKGGLTDLCLH